MLATWSIRAQYFFEVHTLLLTCNKHPIILQLGDREIKGMSEKEIKEAFRGPPDTRVQLGFVRRPMRTTKPSMMHFSLGAN